MNLQISLVKRFNSYSFAGKTLIEVFDAKF
jgi:hypothetical protein